MNVSNQGMIVNLTPIEEADHEQFILDNQKAFFYGATEEFGMRDHHFEDGEEIISRKTIEETMNMEGAETYRIVLDGKIVGGVILQINHQTHHNELDILFVSPEVHSKGIGFATWEAIEALHPETIVWETVTPYFEKWDIHF